MTSSDPPRRRALLIERAGTDSDLDAEHATRLREAGSFFWLDLSGVAPERTVESSAALGLDAEAVQHLIEREQRAAFAETENGLHWVCFGASDSSNLTEVRGVYTKSFLVTAHEQACLGLSAAGHRYERLRDSDQDDGPLVLFMVLDALVNTFEPILPMLNQRLDELEVTVLGGMPMPGYLQEVLEVRQRLTPIIRVLGPYRRDLVGILGSVDRLPGMQDGSQQYFDSHRNHVLALYEDAIDCRDETRDAVESFNSASAERQGEVINWLTIVAAVFLPLTFLTGYFGMNFSLITGLHGSLIFVLLGVVLPCVLAAVTILLLRLLVRRLGVRLIPARAVRTDPSG